MDITTEIRKLPYSKVKELAQILDPNESWKNLMAIIPKQLDKNNYECNVSRQNPCKYHSEHFKLLESSSIKMQKLCTELLFGEWGTSARIRPTLGHLLYLLTKAQLYRAADYVAQTLLNQKPPERPMEGPAAIVTITMPDVKTQDLEKELEAQKYHSSILSNLNHDTSDNIDANLNHSSKENHKITSIPKIIVSEPIGGSLVMESRRKRMNRQNASTDELSNLPSNLIQFSQPELNSDSNNETVSFTDGAIPDISAIMSPESDHTSEPYFPKLTGLNMTSDCEVSGESLPPLTDLLEDSTKMETNSDLNVPNFSILGVDEIIPPVIQSEQSFSLPSFGALLPDPESKVFLPILDNSSDTTSSYVSSKNSDLSHNSNSDSRPKCVSPLPNLSLNTPLPHISYDEVEIATNSFDESPLRDYCRLLQEPEAEINGRFLGSGAFGSVYLGLKLTDKPVAVKKLFLDNVDVVNVDDPVTKQFKNEVEVLSKYQHENLLSLIGYSSDGPTYCLLYEFMPGGALKDRLQNTEEKLIWTDRLYIALGTARAVSYLHTAYSTPLIHRDIKTANILLDCTNKPKLSDFGLIKLIGNQNTNTTNTTAFGTSAYMAREAFRGDVSVKLDTYSFGVVLLELITGLPPLDENREGCDIVTHVEEVCEDDRIEPLTDLKAGSWVAQDINFAEEIYKISTKCLEQNKKKRPTMVSITKELAELIKQCS